MLTEIFVPLSEPVIAGFELTTLMRYPTPDAASAGIVAEIVPDVVPVNVPMAIGLENEPAALDSWAVNKFPAFAAPSVVKATLTAAPAQ